MSQNQDSFSVRHVWKSIMSVQNKENPVALMETELARLIVEQKLATSDEVEQCLTLMARRGVSDPQAVAQTFVDMGVATPGQIQRLHRTLQARQGQQIPGYQILGRLGAGAMATVYKARQLSLDRIVAIKILNRKLSENREYVERFQKEGRAAAKLNHANIVQAIDVGEANGYHYFVMEYVEGRTLYDDIAAGAVYTEGKALDVIIQIARALEHAHAQGFIHRDVKPKNIMITADGTAKLADMGLARSMGDAETAQAEAGRAFGTPYYISPEQIRGDIDIDFRTDIYSLGATLYNLVTGKVPFEAPTPAAVMHRHLADPLVPPDHLNTRLSAGIGEVVEVMMAKDRTHRYASTKDLLLDLQSIAAGQPPLQARKRVNAELLADLAAGEDRPELTAEKTQRVEMPDTQLRRWIIVLAVALGLSVVGNLIQALAASW